MYPFQNKIKYFEMRMLGLRLLSCPRVPSACWPWSLRVSDRPFQVPTSSSPAESLTPLCPVSWTYPACWC